MTVKRELYYSPLCGFCHKVLFFMKKNGIDIPLNNVMSAEHRSALVSGGGKSQVPCLKIEQGEQVQWLYESSDIIEHLRQHSMGVS